MIRNPHVYVSYRENGELHVEYLGETGEKVLMVYTDPNLVEHNAVGMTNAASLLDDLLEFGYDQFCSMYELQDEDEPDESSTDLWDKFNEG